MTLHTESFTRRVRFVALFAIAWLATLPLATAVHAADVNVTVTTATASGQTNNFTGGLRWVLEEDTTYVIDPANPAPTYPAAGWDNTASLKLHKSYMPVAKRGAETGNSFMISGLDAGKQYYLSILPDGPGNSACSTLDNCYTMSGTPVRFAPGTTSTSATVILTRQPLPPARAKVFAFEDTAPIGGTPDAAERGLGGFTVFIYDAGGGPMMTDVFGNPLGTRYAAGVLDAEGAPTVTRLGDGTIHTMTEAEVNDPILNPRRLKVGEALIENIAPGKYGIQVVPIAGQGWKQTTTIEGTPGIDVWIRAGEPMFMIEFGPTFPHAWFGFVKPTDLPVATGTTGTIRGTVVASRMGRPPLPTQSEGPPVPGCWVGLNEAATSVARYVGRCNGANDGEFTIPNVPPGTYQLVVWDDYLDSIISFFTVIINPDGTGGEIGNVAVPKWFGQHEHYVFNDVNGNGVRDANEKGIPDQAINLRFRNGSIFMSSTTDTEGYLPFDEVFPFFSWLVAEVDFARFEATGVTVTVDDGGDVTNTAAGEGKRNPQIQPGGSEQRTETGPALLEGYNSFAGTSHKFEWGKRAYDGTVGHVNGGITGVVYYQVTRAENDPRFAAPETWEPGIPRVQVNLYRADATGVIQETNGVPGIQLADVDNYPFGNFPGPEDQERDGVVGGPGLGDAVATTHSDSWDDNIPTGCVGDTLITDGRCYDGIRNWSQVRPAVFDGGYAFGAPFTNADLPAGPYVVEANAPLGADGSNVYKHQDEQSKNVDFGDTFAPQALPPVCVGDPIHTGGAQGWNVVSGELSLFPGVPVAPALTGNRPNCNFKLVRVADGKNAASDFFMYTDVPVAGHIQGNTTNDIGNATNPNSPVFGEKQAPAHIPISIRDYAGNEVNRIYTDENGRYNGLVPSTYRINAPMPTGVSANMLQVCLNPPTKSDGSPDFYYDPRFTHACYTLNFTPAQTTYLDTPVLPVGAFVGDHPWQLDCAYPSGTPIIREASIGGTGVTGSGDGPYLAAGSSGTLSLISVGNVLVPDPDMARPATVSRDFGFGTATGQVLLNGTPLTLVGSWDPSVLQVSIPSGAAGGQIEIVRDNGLRTVHGITLVRTGNVHRPVPGALNPVQAAIDAAAPGDVVLVPPGIYTEPLIVTKPIQLQGWGAYSTIISVGRNVNFARTLAWQVEAHRRANCPLANANDRIGLLPGQPNNVGTGIDACAWEPGTGLLATEEAAGVLVAPRPGVFGTLPARIDGFTFTTADFSAGVLVNGYANNLEISNNIVSNNMGQSAGGIRVGHASLLDGNNEVVNAQNVNVRIHHNHVAQNGSTLDHGGGIGLYNGSGNYRVQSNYVCGNFTQGDGAGIAHYGRSPGGLIEKNQILFNQSFDQTAQGRGGSGGGILVAGHEQAAGAAVALSAGTGSLKIVGNNIQGNQAGTGDGGGIALLRVNGQDLLASSSPRNWNQVDVLDNMIVNNVAALAGGGISLQDAVRVNIVNNTVANNDSTATAAAAFAPGVFNESIPQPAGIVSRTHSLDLQATGLVSIGDFSNPLIRNDVILGNRAQHWNALALPPGLQLGNFWDLGLIGMNGRLDAEFNVLSSESPDPTDGVPYAGNNLRISATTGETTLLAAPYFNRGSVGATNDPLLAAAAIDEGGNFISVVHYPLTPTGNYHLAAGSSAIDAGTNDVLSGLPSLLKDYDGQPRPVDGTNDSSISIVADIGADEVASVVVVTDEPPQILSTAPLDGYRDTLYQYQVVAVDRNGTTFTYGLTCDANPITRCGTGGTFPQIDANGLLTWTPPAQGGNPTVTITVYACSPDATPCNDTAVPNLASQTFDISVAAPGSAPTARADSYDVNVQGTFSVAATAGVLSNDSPSDGSLSAELVSNLSVGGSVSLAPSGAFSYVPEPGWVGMTSFTYFAAGSGPDATTATISNTVAVTLNRELTATSMQYFAAPGGGGEWRFAGNGSVPGRRLTFTRDRGAVEIGTKNDAVALDNTWTFSTVTGPDWQAGDTVTIVATGGGASFTLGMVPVSAANGTGTAATSAFVQCPIDADGNGLISDAEAAAGRAMTPPIVCKHLAAGDGWSVMADGTELYTFGFSDVSKVPANEAIAKGILNAQFPAPTLDFDEGDEVYLTLTNVGMLLRPDLFDPHSVHFHGFPNAASVFDGVPEASITINMGFSFTYYYKTLDPGTYMYHCHVEASEHMQMGMLGNLYVRPKQNGTLLGGRTQFAYNDSDGSTGYDVEYPIQIGSFDRNFHEQHIGVQPLPFAEMHDDYPMLNGRGYPDTVNEGVLPAAPSKSDPALGIVSGSETAQPMNSRIVIAQGQKALLRISNLNVTRFYTLATTGLPMQVVGTGAHILRGPAGGAAANMYYTTNSVTLGGGEGVDVLIDTTGVAAGTYLLYSTNLEALSNGAEDFGGMMTEIVVQ
ncbi:MAG: multicopper oxidase domain-containing protein [Gammaproteobacteria bacterium]|nr:multicopper oxidase domain-containing protein [Gammaproteobacteria bacterium]